MTRFGSIFRSSIGLPGADAFDQPMMWFTFVKGLPPAARTQVAYSLAGFAVYALGMGLQQGRLLWFVAAGVTAIVVWKLL